jgi:hypothetical protein
MLRIISTFFNWIHDRFYFLFLIFIISALAVVLSDASFKWMGQPNTELLSDTGSAMAVIGIMCATIALAYYASRQVSVALKNQKTIFKEVITSLRLFHPAIGAAAVTLLLLHGYIELYRINGLNLTIVTGSGLLTLLALLVLASYGTLLYHNAWNRTLRKAHRTAAFILISTFLIHLSITSMF